MIFTYQFQGFNFKRSAQRVIVYFVSEEMYYSSIKEKNTEIDEKKPQNAVFLTPELCPT